MLSDSYLYTRSVLSNSGKREILWNVVQPGDPYDIKRSMISKMPGDKKLFMGNHLELVCLLQAAQIQRLSQFLQDHKLKFRQIERNILDRHSYEIQIKELTQEIDFYQKENSKLKDFIKMQGTQIEDLQRSHRNSNVQEKFMEINGENREKMTKLINQNAILLQFNQEYRINQQNFISKLQALEKAKNKEIEELKLNYAQQSHQNLQNTLNIYKFQSQGQMRRLQFQLKKIKEICNIKDSQIVNLKKSNEIYLNQLNLNKIKGENKSLQQKIQGLQSKLKFVTAQIDRKTITLAQINSKYEESQRKKKDLEQKIKIFILQIQQNDDRLKTSDNQILRLREIIDRFQMQKNLTASQKISNQYQFKINQLIRQNEFVKAKLVYQLNISQNYKQQLQKISFENSKYKLLQKQNIRMKESLLQKDLLKRKVIQLQNHSNIVNQQVERISKDNLGKDKELQKFRAVSNQYERLKIKIREVELGLTNKYQSQLARIKSQYQHKIEYLTRTQGNQFQSKTQNFQKQSQRLKQLLKNKTQQSQRYKARLYQLQNYIKKTQAQTTTKLKNLQNSFVSLKKDNDQLYLNSRKFQSIERQKQQLINLLKMRQQEINSLRNKLRQTESNIQKIQLEVNRKIGNYDQNIGAIQKQNEELIKKINQLINESNKKLGQSSQQINMLNVYLRNAKDQNKNLQSRLNRLLQDHEQLKRRLQQAQVKCINILNEKTLIQNNLIQQNNNLKKQLTDNNNSVSQFERDVNKKISINEQNIVILDKENENLKRKVLEYQGDINKYKQKLSIINNNYKNLIDQYEKLGKNHLQYQQSVRNKLDGQVNSKYANYEQNILSLRNQIQIYKRKNIQMNSRMLQQNQQLQKIDLLLKNSLNQQQAIKKQLITKQGHIFNLQLQNKNKIINYQTNIQNLKKIHEDLKANLNNSISLLNRKTEQFNQLNEQHHLLSIQFQSLQRKYNNFQNSPKKAIAGQANKRDYAYEQIINNLQQQRNSILKQLQTVNRQSEKISLNLKNKLEENQSLRRKIQNYQVSIAEYKVQVNEKFGEYEKIKEGLTKQREQIMRNNQQEKALIAQQLTQSQAKIQNLTLQIEKISLHLNQLTQRQNESENKKSQQSQADIQNQLILANKNIQNLNLELKIKQEKLNKAQLKILNQNNQIQIIRKQCNEIQLKFTQIYQIQVVKKYKNYQQAISEYKQQIAQILGENQRLNLLMKSKIDQLDQMRFFNHNLHKEFDQFHKKVQQNENHLINGINVLQRQNQLLKQDFKNNSPNYILEINKSLVQAQNKVRILEQQFQRLNYIIQRKDQQISAQIQNKETIYQHLRSLQLQNKSYQQKLIKQNNDSRLNTQNQQKLKAISQQNERINTILKDKLQEISQLQYINHNLSGELELLRRKNLDQQKLHIPDYQQKLCFVDNQKKQLQQSLRNKNEDIYTLDIKLKGAIQENNQLRRQITENELKYQEYLLQLNRNTGGFQQQEISSSRQRDDFFKKTTEYQSKIAFLMQQMQRINQINKQKTQQLQNSKTLIQTLKKNYQTKIHLSQIQLNSWQSNYKITSNQYENSIIHLQEYQTNLKRLYQQFQRLQHIINDLKKQRQVLFDKNRAFSEEISRLRFENKDLLAQVKEIRLRFSDQSSLQKRINEYMALIVVLFAQIESLRKRLADKQIENEEQRNLSSNIL